MKKKILKLVCYTLFIPLSAALLFTALHALFLNLYFDYDHFWVSEWMLALAETMAYYLVYAALFFSLGISAYAVLFKKTWPALGICAAYFAGAFLYPMLRYLVRHFCLMSSTNWADMAELYTEDMTTALNLLIYFAIGIGIVWLEKAFYCWILKEKPQREGKFFSPKNPIGLAFFIFFAAWAVLATINFVISGEFSGENIVSILLEYTICIAGFFLAVLGAYLAGKWVDASSESNTPKETSLWKTW